MDDWRTHTEEGRLLERVWYIASREPSDTPPDRNSFAFPPKGKVFTTPYAQGFQVSLSRQPPPLGQSLGPSNQRSSKTSQACYGYPRCNLDLMRLFFQTYFHLPSPTRWCQTPFAYFAVPNPRLKCGGAPVPVMPNTRRSSALQCVHCFSFPLAHDFPRSPALST